MNKNILTSGFARMAIGASLVLLLLPISHAQALASTSSPAMAPTTMNAASSVSTRAPGYCISLMDKDLRFGQVSNKDMKARITVLQLFLERENLFGSNTLGTFGPVTLAAVKKFQAEHGLPATGFVGPMTRAKIIEIAGCDKIPPTPQAVTVTSPNGSDKWDLLSNQYIQWKTDAAHANAKFDINLIQTLTGNCFVTVTPCPVNPAMPMPYVLDKNISGNQYYWIAGTDIANGKIPRGEYKIQVCTTDPVPSCDLSDQSFKLVDPAYEANKEPVITEIVGPTTLKYGDTGVWTVKAYDPEGGPLSYYGGWAGRILNSNPESNFASNSTGVFEVKFPLAATYTVEFVVVDSMSKIARKTIQVMSN